MPSPAELLEAQISLELLRFIDISFTYEADCKQRRAQLHTDLTYLEPARHETWIQQYELDRRQRGRTFIEQGALHRSCILTLCYQLMAHDVTRMVLSEGERSMALALRAGHKNAQTAAHEAAALKFARVEAFFVNLIRPI